MARKEEYEAMTESLIAPIIERYGFELVDVEYVKEGSNWYLRVYIDKEGGITVDDCEAVSREFNEILDKKDYIKEAYIFEVSSPGLLRPFKKDKDFNRNIGCEVEVRLFKAVNQQKEFQGQLKAFDREHVTLASGDGEVVLERSNIALIRKYFEW